MRLFLAIPLPDDVKQRLGDLQQPMEGIRWQPPRRYHLTLRFIGEADRDLTQAIHKQLEEIKIPPFKLNLKAPGYFPENRYPRVLWAGVEEESQLMELQRKIEQVCREAGLKPEKRKYNPHITLGKVKGAPKQDVLSFINQHKRFRMSDIPVTEFILYSSRLHPDGAIHKPLERYSLKHDA